MPLHEQSINTIRNNAVADGYAKSLEALAQQADECGADMAEATLSWFVGDESELPDDVLLPELTLRVRRPRHEDDDR